MGKCWNFDQQLCQTGPDKGHRHFTLEAWLKVQALKSEAQVQSGT